MSADQLTADGMAIEALSTVIRQTLSISGMELDVQAVKEEGTDYIGFVVTDKSTKSRITYMFPKGSGDDITDLFDAGLSIPLQQVLSDYSRSLVEAEGVDES